MAICVKFVKAFIGKWRRDKTQTPTPEPPAFFNCFLSGKHNLNSSSQSAYTEFQAMPLSVQYQAHSSYYSKFEVACYKDPGTHQHCVATNCRFKQSFLVNEVDIQWALYYLYTKATGEVDKFTKPNKIQRDMFRLGGILFHNAGSWMAGGT